MKDPRAESRLGSGGLLASDASRVSAGQESMLAQTRYAQEEQRRVAAQDAPISCKIISKANGLFNVETTDGRTISGVGVRRRTGGGTNFPIGAWVLVEWVSGVPQIVGYSPVGAG